MLLKRPEENDKKNCELIYKSSNCWKDKNVIFRLEVTISAQRSQSVVIACDQALCAVQQRLLWLTIDLIENRLFFIAEIELSAMSDFLHGFCVSFCVESKINTLTGANKMAHNVPHNIFAPIKNFKREILVSSLLYYIVELLLAE